MKFSVVKKDFLKAANQCSRTIEKVPRLPMYSMILIELSNQELKLTGSNGITTIRSSVPKDSFKCMEPGSICVECRHLCGFLSKMDDGLITCEYSDTKFVISTDYGKFNIASADKSEYPNLDFEIAENEIGFEFEEFCNAVRSVMVCTFENQQRPILGGVNISSNCGKVNVGASDGKRCHIYTFTCIGMDDMDITIPKKTCNEVINIFEDQAKIFYNDKKIQFINDELYFSSGLLNGKFPDLSHIIPDETYDIACMNSIDVIGAVDRSRSIINEDKIQIIKLDFKDSVRFSSVQIGVASTDEILKHSMKVSGDDFNINLNAKHLKDAIVSINSEEFILEKKSGLKPIMIRSKSNEKLKCILTPIRVWE